MNYEKENIFEEKQFKNFEKTKENYKKKSSYVNLIKRDSKNISNFQRFLKKMNQ